MLDLDTLVSFVRVIERGSFSATANELGVTPSSISKKVSRLEQDVGAKLINRSTHELHLTEAGRVFFERAKRILLDIDEAKESVHEVSTKLAGSLKIHLTPGTGQRVVLPLLLDFIKLHPQLTLDIAIQADAVDLLHNGFDLSIRSSAEGDRKLASASIDSRRLVAARYRICASADYLARHGRPAEPAELARHNCLIYARQPSPREWWFKGAQGRYPVHVNGNVVADEWSVVHEAALAGVGIARFLTTDGDALERGPLEPLFSNELDSDRSVWAFHPRMRSLPRKLEALLAHLQAGLAAAARAPSSPFQPTSPTP